MYHGITTSKNCNDCGIFMKQLKSGRNFDRCKDCYNIFIAPYCICTKRGIKCIRRANSGDLCSSHEHYRYTERYTKWVRDVKKQEADHPKKSDPIVNVPLLSPEEMNAFQVLGINYTVSKTEIKKAFFTKARELHPDKSLDTTEDEFRAVHEAFKLLSSVSE